MPEWNSALKDDRQANQANQEKKGQPLGGSDSSH